MNYKNRVQKYLADMGDLGTASKPGVCEHLNVSPSMLEIYLAEHKTGWFQLLDNERRNRCAAWVLKHRHHTSAELAASYGAASGESAVKKFKDWYGFAYVAFQARPTDYYIGILREAAYE